MLATLEPANNVSQENLLARVAEEERAFYEHYGWSLNPHLTVGQAAAHLQDELDRLLRLPAAWQRRDVAVNIWLLASGILNAADERLRGKTVRLAPLRRIAAPIERVAALTDWPTRAALRRWRDAWLTGLEAMLPPLLGEAVPDPLPAILRAAVPATLADEGFGIPSPFQRLDLTHEDVLALGRALMQRVPDRDTPLALIGLRTSGSYFAPLIKLQLERSGYHSVRFATLEPNKGSDRSERETLRALAAEGRTAVIIDDPPHSGSTLHTAIAEALKAKFARDRVMVLAPTHPAKRDWPENFPAGMVVTLVPEHWYKRALMQPMQAQVLLSDYLGPCDVIESERAQRYTALLRSSSSDARVPRLKQVFEVRCAGAAEATFVLAKSVGYGWYSYPAFLAASRLAGHVPPVLGLRHGILYTQYIPQPNERDAPSPVQIAEYVAGRTRALPLGADPKKLKTRNGGMRLLEKALSGAYGRPLTGSLMRRRIGHRLRALPIPRPTWIDGNMQACEWIAGPHRALKTDFEHHGLGKAGLNTSDPCFDLADAMFNFALSPDAQDEMLSHYVAQSGDDDVRRRLFMNKLLAGIWNINQAQEQVLGRARDSEALAHANARFLRGWHFLTEACARHAGAACRDKRATTWRAPLVFLDVDGVIDRRLFGFPATTAAGIEALATLGGRSVVLNTARSIAEIKTYCEAYGLCGGVAEYGSYMWDALREEGRLLVSEESLRQLEVLRVALARIPGVFIDERYTCSVRAFTYRSKSEGLLASLLQSAKRADIGEGAVAPLSPVLVSQVIADLGLDRVRVHHTTIDTTIVAREVDKGTGLVAMRDWLLGPQAETIAVGDSEADLAMFKTATRSFAPAHIRCKRAARLLGCEIAGAPYQRGLLQIAQRITGKRGACAALSSTGAHDAFVADILRDADRPWIAHLWRGLRDPAALSLLLR